jgi:hypothetical protein
MIEIASTARGRLRADGRLAILHDLSSFLILMIATSYLRPALCYAVFSTDRKLAAA